MQVLQALKLESRQLILTKKNKLVSISDLIKTAKYKLLRRAFKVMKLNH